MVASVVPAVSRVEWTSGGAAIQIGGAGGVGIAIEGLGYRAMGRTAAAASMSPVV
ncbi:Uncharacterised protein [Mycobacteroides abscessus subsp. abscessus]|nr:Uncharacterised protein [Mycobacteroides abscessus subsp. abscessus]